MKKPDFKAVIIEASAGTGKTSRITSEFTALLDAQNPAPSMKKILAITFSEKAAIEMKTRILEKIYRDMYPFLGASEKIDAENAMLKLNISTIHSFCRRILRRFAFYINVDPFFSVVDEGQSSLLFYRAFGRVLNSERAENMAGGILKDIKLSALKEMLYVFRNSHPYISAGIPEGEMTCRIASLFLKVSDVYAKIKEELSFMDFDDLENTTYRLVSEHPESLAILEDFDEKCSYIFVDEFQDTNMLQWKIMHKFFDEWLAGYGAKADKGESYGVFLVGDKKQSIYGFRGAESGIFDVAKKVMAGYSETEQLSKNYRSAKGILDFINNLFENIPPWTEQKLYAGLPADISSGIEINISGGRDSKEMEYKWVISKIFELVEKSFTIWDKKSGRTRRIDFKDIAILMRGRAGDNFAVLEKQLKEAGLPFVIMGGIGFYGEPEIIFLLAVIFALADPADSFSLWTLLNSVHKIKAEDIYRWRKLVEKEEASILFEKILEEIRFWEGLSLQQKANTEKFLMILQDFQHMPLYSIAKNLRDLAAGYDEPKADIFSIHQNAVRVLTVHGAKGLEFPAVFLVNIEDGSVILKDKMLYERTESEVSYKYTLKKESAVDKEKISRAARKEEEMRVLYVALTRAGQYLFISGADKKGDSKLWLNMIRRFEDKYPASKAYDYRGFSYASRIPGDEISFSESGTVLTSYSYEADKKFFSYEKTVVGQIVHKLLYELSRGSIRFEKKDFMQRARFYLQKSGLRHKSSGRENILENIYEKIEANKEIKNIVLKNISGKTFSELPFIVKKHGRVYEGFIDRVIIDSEGVSIYDYKTDRVELSSCKKQMDIYEAAVQSIFKSGNIKKLIIFLKEGRIYKL